MSAYTATTVPTQFVEANGIRFAYRRWGKRGGLPLVFNQHFTGNLDNWDPAVLDRLAKEREVIIFNNAGVGSLSGEGPRRFSRMGKKPSRFLDRRNGRAADHARPSGARSQTRPCWYRPAQSRLRRWPGSHHPGDGGDLWCHV